MIAMKTEIRTDRAAKPAGPYSQGLKAGNMVFTAGQGGADPATGKLAPDIASQTRQALENIKAILAEGGASMSDVVKATVHLSDMDNFDAFNAVYETYFPLPRPVRTTVESGLGGMLVEIDVIAVV